LNQNRAKKKFLKFGTALPDRENEPAENSGQKGGDNPTRLNPTPLTRQENAGREAGNKNIHFTEETTHVNDN
jgi:hypothetical protein